MGKNHSTLSGRYTEGRGSESLSILRPRRHGHNHVSRPSTDARRHHEGSTTGLADVVEYGTVSARFQFMERHMLVLVYLRPGWDTVYKSAE